MRSPSFKAAKTDSTGAVEYEYGPENITLTPNRANRFLILALVCHFALSSRIIESSYQPGDSWSSCRNKCLRNSNMILASVFAYVNAHHIFPLESRANINEILGATCLSVMDPAESEGTQILLKNRVWFSQLSSTFMILFPDSSSGRSFSAYYYLSTKQRSELLWIGTVLARRYPIDKSFLITF